MLPRDHRMTRPAEFTRTVRAGDRARTGTLVVHRLAGASETPTRIGLVVSRAVGTSVVRHRVSRRLRAQLALRLADLPAGWSMVVRALPAAGAANSARLGRDLDDALARVPARTAP